MINALIIDDEIKGTKVLEHLLKEFTDIHIMGLCTDAEQAIAMINEHKPQLILLDINMPKYNGFEILDKISHKDYKVIFVTAYNEYALKAFNYSAIDYLLKPVDNTSFKLSIQKAIDQINQQDFTTSIHTLQHNLNSFKDPMSMKLCISNINGFSIINAQDIIYCEADSCYTIFKLKNNTQIISSKTLSEYEEILDKSLFFRIHRSYIINLDSIVEYRKGSGGNVVMSNGAELEVSRRKKEEFLERVRNIYVRNE